MAAVINRHGLSRDIPSAIAREVRQRCGFGCVVCGSAIYQYEHLDPLFAEAFVHDPLAIVLLCGGCHDRVTRRLLSKESVRKAAAHPKALQNGFSFGPFDFGDEHPEVVAGTLRAIRTRVVLQAFGTPILEVAPPESAGGPFRLSAVLCDFNGKEVLRIVENEWRAPTYNWDLEISGPRIFTRRAPRDVTLQLRAVPPRSLVIEKLEMYYRGAHIICEENTRLRVRSPSGAWFEAEAATVEGCEVALDITETGLSLGRKCASVHLARGASGTIPPSHAQSNRVKGSARNKPCPCGSGLKYKKCHGKT